MSVHPRPIPIRHHLTNQTDPQNAGALLARRRAGGGHPARLGSLGRLVAVDPRPAVDPPLGRTGRGRFPGVFRPRVAIVQPRAIRDG